MMPETNGELAWWGFNIVLLILIAWAKYDLSEIKNDSKKNRELNEANSKETATIKATCVVRHKHIEDEINSMFERIRELEKGK